MTDVGPEYIAHRTRLAEATALDEMLSRVRTRDTAKPKGEGGPAAPSAEVTTPDPEADGSLVGRVAKDMGRGVVETPRAVVSGVRDAIQNTIKMGDELGSWLEGLGVGGIKIDGDGVSLVSGEELQGLRRPADMAKLPEIGAPSSVTGSMVKGVTQFVTGMAGVGKAMKLAGVTKAAGAAGYAQTALQGAAANFAAFDPHQNRLSNLIESVPALQNPVTAYLASDPSDGDAEGRFKNALEGLGLGVMTDGFVKGVRMLREVSRAKATASTAAGAATDGAAAKGAAGVADDAFREMGDEAAKPGSPLVTVEKPKPVAPSAGGAPVEPTPGKIKINFARIDAADDVQKLMQDMADLHAGNIDEARRGVQTFEQTKLNAQQQDAWAILSKRREGEPLNAEQSLAARQLWVSASEQLSSLAAKAAEAPSEANLFAFRKMLAIHGTIQQQVIAARTETARALSSWRIPAGGGAERLRDIAGVLEQQGGAVATRELAARVAGLARAGMHTELNNVAEAAARATTGQALMEVWINGLLSGPKTHIANMMSNSAVIGLRMAERGIAAKIAAVLGDEGSVAAGEAAAQWFGLTSGIKDAFRYAAKAARTGDTGFGLGKIEAPHPAAISSEALGLSSSGWLGRGADMLGSIVRVPGRALAAEDEFFKTLGYRMELHAQALRQATSEVASGAVEQGALKSRIAELVLNPPENLRMAAVDSATYQTFTNAPGKLGDLLGKATSQMPALKIIMPFTRTPANIVRFTFERTPLAPLMSQFRQNLAAGGARRDLALAQIGLGTSAMLMFADMTLSGQVTGRGTPEKGTRAAQGRAGWQPYSVKIGDRWFAYNRLDPVGSLIGMAADATESIQFAQMASMDDPDVERLAVATSVAFAGNLVNKTYLSGLSSIIEALNDPQRSAERWAQRLAGSIVPTIGAQAARTMDPYQREVYSMMDAIRARTPGLSDTLAPRLSMWGDPVSTESGLGAGYDAMIPIATKDSDAEPIDLELIRLEANVSAPSRKTEFDGVSVDLSQYPKAYSRYVELAGNALKHPAWGLGAKDLLNRVVEGKHPLSAVYRLRSDGPDGGKDVFITDLLLKYRSLARAQVLREFPEIADQVQSGKERQRELRLPVMR